MQYVISFLEGIITFISPCLLPMLPVYVSYFANYTATATNYMYINKVSGSYIRSAMNMRLGEVMPSEETPIVCYDHNCLNFRHDHSSWDDYTEDEETEDGTTTDGGATM